MDNLDPHPWFDTDANPQTSPYWRTAEYMSGMVFDPRPGYAQSPLAYGVNA